MPVSGGREVLGRVGREEAEVEEAEVEEVARAMEGSAIMAVLFTGKGDITRLVLEDEDAPLGSLLPFNIDTGLV